MRKCFLFAIVVFACGLAPVRAQSQGDMNHQSFVDFQKIDKELNDTYAKLLPKLGDNGKKKLKETELHWLAYRDSQARLEADAIAEGGSMAPLLYNEARARMTEVRIKELQDLLRIIRG